MTTNHIVPITAPITEADMRRFWAKVAVDPSGCLVWTASTFSTGYGQFKHGGRTVTAHRFGYTALVGPIPDGLVLDHLCRNKRCAAPDHLEPVTDRVNILRGDTLAALLAAKTHCLNGHPFDEVNTRIDSRGMRQCRTCEGDRRVARYAKKRDEINEYRQAWRAANRERLREQERARKAADPGKFRELDRTYRAAKRAELDKLPKCGQVTRRGNVCDRPAGHEGRHRPRVERSAAGRDGQVGGVS